MELFEDPEYLNAQKSIKELVRVRSIIDAFKFTVKASPLKFFLIFLILILPLSLLQLLFEANTRYLFDIFTWDLYYKSSYLLSDQRLVSRSIHDCVYLILFSTFYLSSTSAMTFVIAGIHVSILSAIPGTLKRLAITFFHALPIIFLIYVIYLVVFALIALIISGIYMSSKTDHYVVESLLIVAIVFLTIGYLLVLFARAQTIASWNFANVVSVLEPNTYGSAAIKKSKELLQEKVRFKIILSLLHMVTDVFVGIVHLVMLNDMNIKVRVSIISLCAIALAAGNFLGLTAHNLMYYVCTDYDSQVIGKGVSDDCVLEMQEFGKDNRVEGDKLEV